jgi:hypothetical protein
MKAKRIFLKDDQMKKNKTIIIAILLTSVVTGCTGRIVHMMNNHGGKNNM